MISVCAAALPPRNPVVRNGRITQNVRVTGILTGETVAAITADPAMGECRQRVAVVAGPRTLRRT